MTEEFLAQYYSAAPAVPAAGRRRPGAARARAELLAEALSRPPRRPGRGPGRRARRRSGACASSPSATPRSRSPRTGCASERRRAQRVDALSALQDALGLESLPVRIEGFDISNIGGEHTVASMVVFEGGAPKKSDYRRFRIRGDRAAGPTTSPRWRRCSSRRVAQLLEQADRSPHDAERDESFAAVPDLIVIDGGKGQLSAGMRALGAAGRARHRGDRARQAARGGLRPGALASRSRSPPTPRPCGCCSGSATRRTGSRSTTTAAAATRR